MYHLIATVTVRSQFNSKGKYRYSTGQDRAPQFILSSADFDEVYDRARQIGGEGRYLADKQLCLGEVPVFSTEDWTYWIVEQK